MRFVARWAALMSVLPATCNTALLATAKPDDVAQASSNHNITSFYGSSCANNINDKGALTTPQRPFLPGIQSYEAGGAAAASGGEEATKMTDNEATIMTNNEATIMTEYDAGVARAAMVKALADTQDVSGKWIA
eukprot:405995-Prorocentrum_minimum.AAC.1